jgi:lipooligosaccharide transport system permease protein
MSPTHLDIAGAVVAEAELPAVPAQVATAPADRRLSITLTRAVWRRNRDVFARLWTWLLIPNVVDVCLSMLALGLGLGAAISGFGGDGYAAWIAPGLVVCSALFSAGFECSYGTYYRMDKQRTFDAMVATPVQLDDVVLGELWYGAFRGTVSASVIAVIFAAFGLFDSWWALLLPAICFLGAYMMSALAVTAASVSPMLETLGYWVSFGIFPMYWLSGTFYDPSEFGPVVQALQYLSPAWHAVELARSAAGTDGATFDLDSLVHAAVLVSIALIGTWSAITLMRRRLVR